jgi:hypothetical protein
MEPPWAWLTFEAMATAWILLSERRPSHVGKIFSPGKIGGRRERSKRHARERAFAATPDWGLATAFLRAFPPTLPTSDVSPKFASPSDPTAQWTTVGESPVFRTRSSQIKRHSCLLSPRAFFGVSFLMCAGKRFVGLSAFSVRDAAFTADTECAFYALEVQRGNSQREPTHPSCSPIRTRLLKRTLSAA